ncbi:MAG: hypothetical protein KKA81_01960 [Bacteroidetes bacterium]|nr:hypothetical protein [Bacteroidota bacterium]
MLRKICIIISGLIFPLLILSQEFHTGSGLSINKSYSGVNGNSKLPDSIFIKQTQLRYSLSTGMSFVSWGGLGTMTTQFISPSISARINRKVSLSGGVRISNLFINTKVYEGMPQEKTGTVTSAMLWLRTDYQVNSRLGFSGILYKDFTPGNQIHDSRTLNIPQSEGFMIDMQYRPSRNLEINAGFGYHRGTPIYTGYDGRLWGESSPFYPGVFETGPGF